MKVSILNVTDAKDISSEILMENGKLKLLPAEYYSKFLWPDFRLFCHNYARYGIPTVELVDYIKSVIDGRSAIEIGSGAGDLGYHLGIKMTDSRQQELPSIRRAYASMKQPVIKYPDDVEKLEGLEAVNKYKPQVVVASWVTPYAPTETHFGSNPFGIHEEKILRLVETFIIVGNLDTHWDKPIRYAKHETIKAPWIISRGKNQQNNCIFIWDNRCSTN